MSNARKPCPGLWKTPVIRHDGQLMACCADVNGEIEVGNLKDNTFQGLWEGERMNQYRLWHIEGRFDAMPKCLSCGGIGWIEMTPPEVHAFLEGQGRMDLWPIYSQRLGLGEG